VKTNYHNQAFRAARASTPATRPFAPTRFITPFQARLLSNEVRSAIDKAVASAPVVLFMKGTPETPQCGFSRASIQILGMQGVDPEKFTAFNVLEDQDLRAGKSKYCCRAGQVVGQTSRIAGQILRCEVP
jgi:monothiol glutaredoxin